MNLIIIYAGTVIAWSNAISSNFLWISLIRNDICASNFSEVDEDLIWCGMHVAPLLFLQYKTFSLEKKSEVSNLPSKIF